MFHKLDGSGRLPRPIQVEALSWLKGELKLKRPICLNLPTGTGKSFIMQTILEAFGDSVGIIPSNSLMSQFVGTYPNRNYIKGKEHYQCTEYPDLTCIEAQEYYGSACLGCTYTVNKSRASEESTVFNPISYYFHKRGVGRGREDRPTFVVVDEAHKLADMASLLVDVSFRKSKYDYPELTTEHSLLTWLITTKDEMVLKLKGMKSKSKDRKALARDVHKVDSLIYSFSLNPQDFVFYTENRTFRKTTEEYLVIRPIVPPRAIIRDLLDADYVILMSATLLHHNIWELGINNYSYLDLPSPVDVSRRQVHYEPGVCEFNYKTSPKLVAEWIKGKLAEYPDKNTLIHVSYAWSVKLKPLLPNVLINTSEDKDEVLDKFKKEGGVWLASGCSEGLDLPGDLCRLIIIPMITRANIADPVVQKQLAKERGNIRYDLNAISNTIQQAGRGCRGEEDFCTTIVGDRSFPDLITRNRKYLPISFLQSIIWRKKD